MKSITLQINIVFSSMLIEGKLNSPEYEKNQIEEKKKTYLLASITS